MIIIHSRATHLPKSKKLSIRLVSACTAALAASLDITLPGLIVIAIANAEAVDTSDVHKKQTIVRTTILPHFLPPKSLATVIVLDISRGSISILNARINNSPGKVITVIASSDHWNRLKKMPAANTLYHHFSTDMKRMATIKSCGAANSPNAKPIATPINANINIRFLRIH